ncbi:hypothetical protein M0805_000130 [Coniferiporia weirii]|nr:hypothetical protein M0805_000130 [Coniferiporia weirii]
MSPSAPSSPSFKLRSLPIIDISPWIHPVEDHYRGHNGGRRSTSAAIHAACLTYGFFYLDISSFASQVEMDELANLAKQFFALPQIEKEKLGLANQDGARGYQRLKENVTNNKADNHEGLDFYAPVAHPDKTKPLHGENQWPSDDAVPTFREKYSKWVDKMKVLGLIVMEAMSVGLGMTEEEWSDLKSKVDDSFWVMRVIGYPPLPNDYDGFSCGAHKDYGCLTFLCADPTPNALEVFLPRSGVLDDAATTPIPSNSATGLAPSAASTHINDGGSPANMLHPIAQQPAISGDKLGIPKEEGGDGVWITADPLPGCVVCNVGEMWEIWTNGLYKSTLHRVVHRGTNYRVPFFFEPNFNALVEPLSAAIRLQKDSIQPAYAYTPHLPHISHPHHHHDGPAETLTQRLRELVAEQRERSYRSSPDASSASHSAYGDDAESDRATGGWTSVRSSLSISSGDLKAPHSPATPHTPSAHAHVAHTPLSVERHYSPVVYGEFLLNKVTNNFATGKGKYD